MTNPPKLSLPAESSRGTHRSVGSAHARQICVCRSVACARASAAHHGTSHYSPRHGKPSPCSIYVNDVATYRRFVLTDQGRGNRLRIIIVYIAISQGHACMVRWGWLGFRFHDSAGSLYNLPDAVDRSWCSGDTALDAWIGGESRERRRE